jgi:pimeloyl-ACP methyl ester carboxylesterase/Tol biopolymer transport system component
LGLEIIYGIFQIFKNHNIIKKIICTIIVFAATIALTKAQLNDQYMRVQENSFPKTEKMIDVGSGRILNCKIYGQGFPTIVLVTGFNGPQSNWDSILPFLFNKATVVTYDRPGIGKSVKGNLPLDGGQSARDLHILLEKIDVPKPYIVVGHSLGVDIVRLFVSMYPEDVKGLILEDGSHESLLDEQLKILKGKDLQALQEAASKTSRPANPQNEAEYREETNEQLRKSGPLPHIPFVVITSGDRSKALPPIFSEQARQELIKLGMDLQQKLVDLIPGGKHIIAEGVGHNIHVEKPEILVDPIIEMINKIQARGNTKSTSLEDFYLGQRPPGLTPKIFAPGIVSTDAHEFACSFTPDGTEFYFTRTDPRMHRNQIMVTKLNNGKWTEPSVASFIENRLSFEPRMTADGKRLYFTLEKPVPGQSGGMPMNIWYVEREGENWSEPKNPGSAFNPGKTMYISSTLDGTAYASDISAGPGNMGIGMIRKVNGEYQKLERLGPPINIGKQDMHPYVAPDGSYLIFASKRPSENIKNELFISFKNADGSWGEPKAIDLGMQAGCPMVSPDGKYLFFTAGERGKSDIYWVDASILNASKPVR